jgi:hypothetical protein
VSVPRQNPIECLKTELENAKKKSKAIERLLSILPSHLDPDAQTLIWQLLTEMPSGKEKSCQKKQEIP